MALFLNHSGFLIIWTHLNNLFNKLITMTSPPPFKEAVYFQSFIFCLRQLNEQPD